MFASYVYADSHTATCVAQSFLGIINDNILFPLIIFLTGLALLLFLWGAFRYVWGASDQFSQTRADGRRHMIYGIIGLLVMTSAGAILAIAANTFNLNPDGPECETSRGAPASSDSPDFGAGR